MEDRQTYHLAVAFLQRLLKRLLANTTLAFHPFYKKQDGLGQKDYSANPIFDAYFPDHHKLIRIIQYLPEPGDLIFSAYIDHWSVAKMEAAQRPKPLDPTRSLDPVPELVIALALTRENADTVRELIRLWIVEDMEEEGMGKLLEERF